MTNITSEEICIITDVVDPDTDGLIVINAWGGRVAFSPLTPCCNASATGTEWGTACRACYEDVDDSFGLIYFWNDLDKATQTALKPWLDTAGLTV